MALDAEPVRWGIVSTAAINERVLPELDDSSPVEVIAVASRSQEEAEEFARQWKIPNSFASYDDLLADSQVEAVYIPLPNSLHVEWTIKALEAGKHVLCEKPMDRRAAEVERAFDAAQQAGLVLTEAFMYRHHPQTRRAKELVDAGELGELRALRSTFGFVLDRPADVRFSTELDGGALMDVGCYCVSAARLFCGEPETVIGRQVPAPGGVDIRFAGILAFPGDVLTHFDCGLDLPFNSLVEVVGELGTMRIHAPFMVSEPGIELERDGETESVDVPAANSYQLEFENMSAAIRGDAETLLGRDDALGQARAIEALYRSADQGGEPVSTRA